MLAKRACYTKRVLKLRVSLQSCRVYIGGHGRRSRQQKAEYEAFMTESGMEGARGWSSPLHASMAILSAMKNP